MSIDSWAGFLDHEKLIDPNNPMQFVKLCEELHKRDPEPKFFRSYKDRIIARRLLVNTAMDMGLDLPNIAAKIGRGTLDIWNQEYAKRYGSNIGTKAVKESTRRDIKTRLRRRR